ncbi:ArnT family glycosyltransferase [Leeia oryzae]|uniref:ArnT family glycosyltransferase n=1 Tax=Leeia oryzae TaxID=356662 RepID=UPI000363AA9A|nr:hypothetical protein [Leeia oryzae]
MLTYRPPSIDPNPQPKDHSWLLLLLCTVWLIPGMFGHAPWRNEEVEVIAVVSRMLDTRQWLLPYLGTTPFLDNPPLSYWLGALTAKVFSPWLLSIHEAARLAAVLMMAMTFLLMGMAGRQIWGEKQGRMTVLLLMGSFGLIARAHLIMPEQGNLLGHALVLYGLSIRNRQIFYSGLVTGIGLACAFMGGGSVVLLPLLLTIVLVPVWEKSGLGTLIQWLMISLLTALPLALCWPLSLQAAHPDIFRYWLATEFSAHALLTIHTLGYFGGIFAWFAWPIWPLAASQLIRKRKDAEATLSHLKWLCVTLLWLLECSLHVQEHDVTAIIVLLPLAILATPAASQLKRGWTAAFNWFGRFTFGGFIILAWVGWLALATGWPAHIALRMHRASPTYVHVSHWYWLVFSILITLVWMWMSWRPKTTSRIAVANWATGMTTAWGLLMTLWLPWVVAAKDYRPMLVELTQHLPKNACVSGVYAPNTVVGLLEYYYHIRLETSSQARECQWSLHISAKDAAILPADGTLIWEGGRPNDRRERYRLFFKP